MCGTVGVQQQAMQECSLELKAHSVTSRRSLRANLTALMAQLVSPTDMPARSTRQEHQNSHNKHPWHRITQLGLAAVRRAQGKIAAHVTLLHYQSVQCASQSRSGVPLVIQSCPADSTRSNLIACDEAVGEAADTKRTHIQREGGLKSLDKRALDMSARRCSRSQLCAPSSGP